MEELSQEKFIIKTDEIFLKYKYERIPTNFEGFKEMGFLASNLSTRATIKKLDIKYKENENIGENNKFSDSINQPDLLNEEENNDYKNFNNEKDELINKENIAFNNSSFNKNKINSIENNKNKLPIHCNKEDEDIIPFSTKIIYSLASFGKMSCLVLLK